MIIDITQPLSPGMAVFPGDAPYEEAWTFRIGPGCPVNVSRVAFSAHCGTHADAPLHYDAAGLAVGALPLDAYIGPCRVIDARGPDALCSAETVRPHLDGAPPRILLRLADSADPKVTAATILHRWLARGLPGNSTSSPSSSRKCRRSVIHVLPMLVPFRSMRRSGRLVPA